MLIRQSLSGSTSLPYKNLAGTRGINNARVYSVRVSHFSTKIFLRSRSDVSNETFRQLYKRESLSFIYDTQDAL